MKARRYTLAEARFILSHVYCVDHVPEHDGIVHRWFRGVAESECCRCSCTNPADLRIYIASPRRAQEWLDAENAALDRLESEAAA